MSLSIDHIIERCIANDRRAQQNLYERYVDLAMQVCYRYANDLPEAEDMVQHTFIRVFQNIAQYDRTKGAFSSWLHQIAIREAIAVKRKQPRWSLNQNILADVDAGYQSNIIEQMTIEELRIVIKQLPESHRVVLMLHYFDGYSHEEIAALLHIEPASSRSRLSRARTELTYYWNLTHTTGL